MQSSESFQSFIRKKITITTAEAFPCTITTDDNLSYLAQGACVTLAALLQYFLMAAFCWMLVEGIYLYLFVVKVYNVSNKLKICHGISWGKTTYVINLSHDQFEISNM